jgi:hypothetical protein
MERKERVPRMPIEKRATEHMYRGYTFIQVSSPLLNVLYHELRI